MPKKPAVEEEPAIPAPEEGEPPAEGTPRPLATLANLSLIPPFCLIQYLLVVFCPLFVLIILN